METEKEELIDRIVVAVEPAIEEWLGAQCGNIIKRQEYRDGSFGVILDVEHDLGIFKGIIREVWINIDINRYKSDENDLWIVGIGLTYNHPGGGSNGSSVGRLDLDAKTLKVVHQFSYHERADEVEARYA